jgi:hypothetical protein
VYGQFEAHRQLAHFYGQLGFTVHPEAKGMDGPKNLGLRDFNLAGIPGDQWFETAL